MARAAEMAQGMGYQENGHPTAFWPVGYPALLAASMWLFGPGLAGPVILNLIAAAAILWLILWFGRHVAGSEAAGRLGALLYAVYPAHIVYAAAALSETVSTAITMAAFALLIARRHDLRWLSLAGLLFGAATLMRAQTLLFPAGALLWMMVLCRGFGWNAAVRAGLAVYLALLAAVLPWSLRNQEQLGSFVLVSTNGGVALITGANDYATGDHMTVETSPVWARVGVPFEQRVQRQVEIDRRLRTMAKEWIAANPGRWLALGPVKMALLWRKDSDAFWSLQGSYPKHARAWTVLQWVNQLFYMMLLALAAFCFASAAWRLLRDRASEHAPVLLLACMPLFVTLLAFLFTGQIRYHYPAMPFAIVAAGWSLARLAAWRPAAAPGCLPSLARATR